MIAIAAMPLQAAKNKGAKDIYLCGIDHSLDGEDISFLREYDSKGQETQASQSRHKNYLSDGNPTKLQLSKIADGFSQNLKVNCITQHQYRKREKSRYLIDHGYQPPTMNCDIYLQEGPHGYNVRLNSVHWIYRDNDNPWMQFGARFKDYDFAKLGFSDSSIVRPKLFIERPKNWGRGNHLLLNNKKEWSVNYTEVSQVKYGKTVFRDWTTSNSIYAISYLELMKKIHASEKIEILVYDSKKGPLFERTLTRQFFKDIESKLQNLYLERLDKQKNPAQKCTTDGLWTKEDVIIVT